MAKAKKASKAKASKGTPGHYTDKGTRKFQSNGPIEWSQVFRAAAKAAGEEREGQGINLAMAYAIANKAAFMKFAKESAERTVALKAEAK
jgi:hypothetical protein